MPNNHPSDKSCQGRIHQADHQSRKNVLTRPLLKYVAETLRSASRKSKTQRMSTTKLMSGKMASLLKIVMMLQQEDAMIKTRKDCLRT